MDGEHKLISKDHDNDTESLYAKLHFYQHNIITATDIDKKICQSIEIDVRIPYLSWQVPNPKITGHMV